ncbi:16S rRNA (guanine(527)-N(7))-methyltransferase RsmG [Sphingomonas sp. NSE70-1]|uniref:Ribosomal RNA small subunit methyltransferase G n=1 Tax=Sphingomonas caseinilyticus TaxID=2908205 RepID=A0ABT0RUT5_9SPHN|nr:16S rRNA (guanine(527)-N(7))-methyltransferase RsmG [Sphingomonas caseinilyticus]MCL6698794.1 16S rRNA (guanine(527)-N(7))-methyltransferase RsmG [Sphingomonas caseinilyticus]
MTDASRWDAVLSCLPDPRRESVSRETLEQLDSFAAMLVEENQSQNLVAAASIPELWTRHIVDGAQLLGLAEGQGSWCDIGSGPGLPGLVIAILGGRPMTLNEPRKLRADFLRRAVAALRLDYVNIAECKVERLEGKFDFITARAVARLDKLFGMACHLAHSDTKWVLPKGEKAQSELVEARGSWQGSFRLVPSRTHPASAIVVADHVQRRGKR